MSIWSRIVAALSSSAGAVGARVASLRDLVRSIQNSETRRQVAFTIAMIALAAKMAKADGVVTEEEVRAFRRLFEIPAGEERNVARVYDIAKRQVGGFEAYAREIARLFGDDPDFLEDIVDGLFHIAKADGVVHSAELAYLETVSGIFGFTGLPFERIKDRHVSDGHRDPYRVLDADPNWEFDRLRAQYRRLVAENHPDRLIARGVPPEFVSIANDRLAAINTAWEVIERAHRKRA